MIYQQSKTEVAQHPPLPRHSTFRIPIVGAHQTPHHSQFAVIDFEKQKEVLLGQLLRINLVGLEDTEPRMVPSNGWKSCLRPPPPGWGS